MRTLITVTEIKNFPLFADFLRGNWGMRRNRNMKADEGNDTDVSILQESYDPNDSSPRNLRDQTLCARACVCV